MGHVLGYTNIDDRGQEGLELAFDEWLAKPGNGKAYEEARDNWNWAGDMSTARIAADVRADAREREPGGRRSLPGDDQPVHLSVGAVQHR